MIKKHDEMIALKKQKEDRLKALYNELDEVTHLNLTEDIAQFELTEKMSKQTK